MPSVNFAELEKILATKSVEAAIKHLMTEMNWSRDAATKFIQDLLHGKGR